MKRVSVRYAVILMSAFVLSVNIVQAQTRVTNSNRTVRTQTTDLDLRLSTPLADMPAKRGTAFSLMPESHNVGARGSAFTITPLAAIPPVVGSGSIGRLTKWTGFASNSVIGNSTIFEDKFGMVGIGTDTPTSRLTVAGMIETLGGLKFPDGTIQTTSATGALFSVPHDATLTGNGTSSSPLGVAIPLLLVGTDGTTATLQVSNFGESGRGLGAIGGLSDSGAGGQGMFAAGGASNSNFGGDGITAFGGSSISSGGGDGVRASGGFSSSSGAGAGVTALGGGSTTGSGGKGLEALGGDSGGGLGGTAIFAVGGTGPAGNGLAGEFAGDVDVVGMLSKGGGSFKIDHPLDPDNRYLYHSFVESPDMKNIYDGNVVTDVNGEATVQLPAYFEALNRDFRYLLTVVGTFAQAIVAEEIKDNRFVVRTSAPNVKVSWQVTGIRQDKWANNNRITVEVEKPDRERGFYLHPQAFDQPEERGIEWARNAELMKQRREARRQAPRER